MHLNQAAFIFVLCLSLFFANQADAQSTEEYLKGMEFLVKGDTAKAVGYFESSTKRNKDAESYWELAKINNNINTLNSLLSARLLIQEAIKKNNINLEYRYLYAELLKKLFRINVFDKDGLSRAKNEYREIIEIDNTSSKAYYELGKLIERDYYEFCKSEIVELEYSDKKEDFYKSDQVKQQWNKFINSLFESGSYVSIKMNSETEELLEEALQYFNLAAKYDRDNVDAYIRMALLLAFSGRYKESLSLLDSVYDRFANNYKLNLVMAFSSYKLKENENSNKYFNLAFNNMDESKRLEYKVESVLVILDPEFKERLLALDEALQVKTLDRYWEIKDPLNLTNENERLLEHYARVFYADHFLSDYDPYIHFPDEIKTAGWQTERGIALLKFGEPIDRKKFRATYENSDKTDYWDFGDFKLAFNETSHRKQYRLSDLGEGHYYSDSKFVYDEIIKATPERYYPEFEGPVFEVPYNAIQFKNIDNKNFQTDFYLNYALSTAEGDVRDNQVFYKHRFGIFLRDKNFSKTYEVKDSLIYLSLINRIKIGNSEYIVNSVSLSAKPEQSNLAFEIFREKDKGVSVYHGKINIKNFSGDSLKLSDIILASEVNFDDKNTGTIQRGNYKILPNPTLSFNKENKPYIYYEIYNLKKGENNLTNFEQEITIREAEDENELGRVVNSVLDVIGFDSKGNKIKLSSNYSTMETDPQIYLQLDLSDYDAGEYLITVTIKDKITGQETVSEVKLNWL